MFGAAGRHHTCDGHKNMCVAPLPSQETEVVNCARQLDSNAHTYRCRDDTASHLNKAVAAPSIHEEQRRGSEASLRGLTHTSQNCEFGRRRSSEEREEGAGGETPGAASRFGRLSLAKHQSSSARSARSFSPVVHRQLPTVRSPFHFGHVLALRQA